MNNPQTRVLFSREQIAQRIAELGAEITATYPAGERLVVLGILKGAFLFVADLVRAIDRPLQVDFMGISSYGQGKNSSGEVKVTKDLDLKVEGAHVLIVEDIVDTGVTLTYLRSVLAQRKPLSIRIAALLDKPERRLRPVEVDFVGFPIPNEFVVGFGLDYAENYRSLPDVCILSEGE